MPEREHLEAYVLNLRFFIQNKEPTSLRNMARLYERECKNGPLIIRFRTIRDRINSELDRTLWYRFNGKAVTYRMVFEGMIYSQFAHADRNKHQLFLDLSDHPFGYMLAMDSFLRCIILVHSGLLLIRNLNTVAFGNTPAVPQNSFKRNS